MKQRTLSCSLLCAGLFFAVTGAAKADPRCQQLEALNRQYAGVSLTVDQKKMKRQLVAWYNSNCKATTTRRASAADW
jgi:hypothetical protein